MNEITRIHLAKTPYNIETQAHSALRAYLDAIEKALHADTDAMREIESRMSELIADRGISGDTVITMADVEALQKQLGDPKDFAGEDINETAANAPAPKKRLMRDSSNAMLGGVCSGIAAYFGWDVVWVRIAAVVLLFITSGVMIPLYIILLVVMPEAKTVSDRLEMAGEPITLETLKQNATASVKRAEPFLLKLFRATLGLFLIVGALVAAAAVASVIIFVTLRPDVLSIFGSNLEAVISVGLMALGGIMLATFCGVLAMMVLRKNTERSLLAALIVTTIIGIVSFGAGAALPVSRQAAIRDKFIGANTTKQLAVNLEGVNTIKVTSSALDVHYSVSNDKQAAKLDYNDFLVKNPKAILERQGDTLLISGTFTKSDACASSGVWGSFCDDSPLDVYITGPALQTIVTDKADVIYTALSQDALSVEQNDSTLVHVASTGTIGTVRVKAAGGSFNATDATIGSVALDVTRNNSTFASIKQLSVVSPTDSCSEPTTVQANHIGDLQVNGQTWAPSNNYACLAVQITDRE
jgi:phage shock protein PspC (stress-responsive transcriptional regulator)